MQVLMEGDAVFLAGFRVLLVQEDGLFSKTDISPLQPAQLGATDTCVIQCQQRTKRENRQWVICILLEMLTQFFQILLRTCLPAGISAPVLFDVHNWILLEKLHPDTIIQHRTDVTVIGVPRGRGTASANYRITPFKENFMGDFIGEADTGISQQYPDNPLVTGYCLGTNRVFTAILITNFEEIEFIRVSGHFWNMEGWKFQ